jgi:hypothetical protein
MWNVDQATSDYASGAQPNVQSLTTDLAGNGTTFI